jgi:hypothetical protein
MEFREHENVIYRGEKAPGFKHVRMTEFIVNGEWKTATPRQITNASTYGTPMTEAEAKEFQGEGWPAEQATEA